MIRYASKADGELSSSSNNNDNSLSLSLSLSLSCCVPCMSLLLAQPWMFNSTIHSNNAFTAGGAVGFLQASPNSIEQLKHFAYNTSIYNNTANGYQNNEGFATGTLTAMLCIHPSIPSIPLNRV